jgi:uncharacterized protein (TIGR02266 family)
MPEDFGESSSIKVLQWLSQYKKLSSKPPGHLSSSEMMLLHDLENKLAHILADRSGKAAPPGQVLEKRKSLRVDANYSVHFQTVGALQKAYISNVSGGGFFIETDKISPIGSKITLEILFPDETTPQTIEAEVSWTNPRKLTATPQGMGVKFCDLPEKLRQKIQKFLNMNLEKLLKKSKPGTKA